jgi:hypothetical protein
VPHEAKNRNFLVFVLLFTNDFWIPHFYSSSPPIARSLFLTSKIIPQCVSCTGKLILFSPQKKDKNRQSEKERQVALFAISVGNQEPLCSPASSSSLVVSPTAVIARPPMIIQFTLFSIGDPFRR